jgi:hypothetical protein
VTRTPNMRNRRDVRGGLFHLFAEVAALTALLAAMTFLAWVMLLI